MKKYLNFPLPWFFFLYVDIILKKIRLIIMSIIRRNNIILGMLIMKYFTITEKNQINKKKKKKQLHKYFRNTGNFCIQTPDELSKFYLLLLKSKL